MPQGTFFTQVVNKGILGHYVATASIVTGTYERFDNFIAQPPRTDTLRVFSERTTATRQRRVGDCAEQWVSADRVQQQFGLRAGVGRGGILPKWLLSAALPGRKGKDVDLLHLLQDNYEMPVYQPEESEEGRELHLAMLESTLKVSVQEFVDHARTLNSADELSIYIAQQLMHQHAPSLLMLTLHDMDIAHAGAFSLYVDAIQRADRLCANYGGSCSPIRSIKTGRPSIFFRTLGATPMATRQERILAPPNRRSAGPNKPGCSRSGRRSGRGGWWSEPIESVDPVRTIGCRLASLHRPRRTPAIGELVLRRDQLKQEDFARYVPVARAFAESRLTLLQRLPLSICPSFLQQIEQLDSSFPAERATLQRMCDFLLQLAQDRLTALTEPFREIHLSSQLEKKDWVQAPAEFIAELTAELWSSGQIDRFRAASVALFAAVPAPEELPDRLTLVVLGQDATAPASTVLRKVGRRGVTLTALRAEELSSQISRPSAGTQRHPANPTRTGTSMGATRGKDSVPDDCGDGRCQLSGTGSGSHSDTEQDGTDREQRQRRSRRDAGANDGDETRRELGTYTVTADPCCAGRHGAVHAKPRHGRFSAQPPFSGRGGNWYDGRSRRTLRLRTLPPALPAFPTKCCVSRSRPALIRKAP